MAAASDVPDWYRELHSRRSEPWACLEFARRFVEAPSGERESIRECWDSETVWTLPNGERLACLREAPGTPRERILTVLVFQAFAFRSLDVRDFIWGLASVFSSCEYAHVTPQPIFYEVARAIGGEPGAAIRAFADRDPDSQSMEAFGLRAVPDANGEFEIHLGT